MSAIVQSISDEYRRYKALAEAALEQVPEAALSEPGPAGGNLRLDRVFLFHAGFGEARPATLSPAPS